MFYGMKITEGLQDWQVIPQIAGTGTVALRGVWKVEDGAVQKGVVSVTPRVRALREDDQTIVMPWTAVESVPETPSEGTWHATLTLPLGGPYRLETTLDCVSRETGEHWMFRGDVRYHLAVGDVFIIAGQSNAAGYGRGQMIDPPDLRVRVLRNSGRWDMAAHPLHDATDAEDCVSAPMGLTGVSPFLAFGKTYTALTGHFVGLAMTASGGSPMDRWDPESTGDLYRHMMEIAQSVHPAGILWFQGCADATRQDAEAYAPRMHRMIHAVRRGTREDLPFYIMQLNRYPKQQDADAWGRIKGVQRKMKFTPHVSIIPTLDLPLGDDIHLSSAGCVLLGTRLAHIVCGEDTVPNVEWAWQMDPRHIGMRFTRPLLRASARPYGDFEVTDDAGTNDIQTVDVQGTKLILELTRETSGTAYVSYGAAPDSPVYPLMDEESGVPVLGFPYWEVERHG